MREFEAIADPVRSRDSGFRRATANQISERIDGLFFVSAARFDGDRAADPAASNITATILRALTLRPRTASQTLQLNLEASCAILADGAREPLVHW